MKRFKTAFLLPFLLCTLLCTGQSKISGTAIQFDGHKIELIRLLDPVSGAEQVLDSDSIHSDGLFQLNTANEGTQEFWLRVNRFRAPIFIAPNTAYTIEIEEKPENVLVDTWQKGSFDYSFLTLDSADVNLEILRFENAYMNFFVENQLLLGSTKIRKKVRGFETTVSEDRPASFAAIYKRYALAELKLTTGFHRDSLYANYFVGKPWYFDNPAWQRFFNLFYADYFQGYDLRFGGETIYNQMKKGMAPDSLMRLIAADERTGTDSLRALIAVKAIAQVYTDPAYDIRKLRKSADYIYANSGSEIVKAVARNLIDQFLNPLNGQNFWDLNASLLGSRPRNETDPRWQLVMVSLGKYDVAEKESQILAGLTEKYPDLFTVSEISIYQSPGHAKAWPEISCKDPQAFLNANRIFSFPHFIWLNADGLIVESNALKMSEGFEARLFKLDAEKKGNLKLKVGQEYQEK